MGGNIKLSQQLISMQKELKTLDQELSSNNLTRVLSSVNKPEKSLFRALSLSIYFSEEHIEEVMRILRLCLVSTCRSTSSSFPSPHRKAKLLSKFSHNDEIIDMYFQNPDAHCFVNDNLELASLAFVKRVVLFTISKDGYLEESIITACSEKVSQPPIMLARVSNRYFCVQSQPLRSVMMFIKENIISQIMNSEDGLKDADRNEDIYCSVDNYVAKPHKKSLSESGDKVHFSLGIEERSEEVYGYPESMQAIYNGSFQYEGLEDYLYHSDYLVEDPRLGRLVVPNQRYTGRLKFFDQSGNYGFIVVDGYGSDLFVHFDDLQKTGLVKEKLLNIRNNELMRFEFTCLEYDGKYKKSKKAVDLKPIPNDY